MSAAVELIQGLYAAFARGDVGAVLGAMSPDIVWNEAENFPYADGNPYVGPEAIATRVFARLGGEWDGFSVNPEQFLDAGETVVVTGRYTGAFKQTGRPIRAQFVHVWTVAGGKAARFQQYCDTLQIAQAMKAATVPA
ncbi:MAG: nuclear transport factor 2 family protein [Phenylobacterium sp.]